MKKLLLLLCLFSICLFSHGQKEDLIKYLDAYKTAEFSESQDIIKECSFGKGAEYTLIDYSSVNGIDFETDIDNINGYKAIVNCKLQNKAGSYIDKKMIAVMYLNKENNKWSVYIFREVCDPLKEYNSSKTKIDANDFYTDKQYVYRNLVYWAIAAGKLNESLDYISKAEDYANEARDDKFSITESLNLINKIIN